jgi:hypothetical protein
MALPIYRAMAYGPSQGEYTPATLYGPLGKLQQGDIAVSPNLLSQFPMGTRVNAVDPNTGEVLRSNLRVADTSWYTPGNPTKNSFELWNDQDLGHASLVAAGSGTTTLPRATTLPATTAPGADTEEQRRLAAAMYLTPSASFATTPLALAMGRSAGLGGSTPAGVGGQLANAVLSGLIQSKILAPRARPV